MKRSRKHAEKLELRNLSMLAFSVLVVVAAIATGCTTSSPAGGPTGPNGEAVGPNGNPIGSGASTSVPGGGGSGDQGVAAANAGTGANGVTAVNAGAGAAPASGSGAVAGTSAGGAAVAADPQATPDTWINESGKVAVDGNSLGVVGYWYAFGDGVTSTQSGNPYRDGMYCVTGEAPGDGDSEHWGAGVGLDLNAPDSEKLPYEYEGKISGFRMRLLGTVPTPVRVQFITNLDNNISPFITGVLDETVVYSIADARVPLEWGVENAGERAEGILYSIQVLAPGDTAAGPIDLCIAEFEPVWEPPGETPVDGPFINSDGVVLSDKNGFGIQGSVYAISDGVSTTQTGNPYVDGQYCIAGQFSGAANDWGAGIAFDLNKAPGGAEKLPFAYEDNVAGFRIGLRGSSPGGVRIQFITSEPQDGNQPFLVGRLNASTNYRIGWAQVPTSWDVEDAGREVDGSLYTLQVYLDGTEAGPFNVCVDEFVPLSEAELDVDAQPAAAGYNGARTVDESLLAEEYSTWKQRHFRDCGDGTACIPRDEGDCISEGVAYGMLLGAGYDDRDSFDRLWAYFEQHKNGNGVMNWQTNACGAAISDGSATDGELDAAMALIQAGCRWGGSYENDARELLQAILDSEVTTCDNRTILKPGDNFGGCDRTNPSYFAPAYYKVFASLTGNSTWTDLANDSYELLASLQGSMSGLVPNWTDSNASIPGGTDGQYGADASRTPWRIATDYAWFGEQRAVTFLDNVSSYVDDNGGIARLFSPNSNYRGGLALSALHQDAAKAQRYTDAWLTTSVDDTSYFPGTLRAVYMLLAAQQFSSGC